MLEPYTPPLSSLQSLEVDVQRGYHNIINEVLGLSFQVGLPPSQVESVQDAPKNPKP